MLKDRVCGNIYVPLLRGGGGGDRNPDTPAVFLKLDFFSESVSSRREDGKTWKPFSFKLLMLCSSSAFYHDRDISFIRLQFLGGF